MGWRRGGSGAVGLALILWAALLFIHANGFDGNTLLGDSMDLVIDAKGAPDFVLHAKRNGTRTGQTWRIWAPYIGPLNASQATSLGQWGWVGNVTEIARYDLYNPSIVWVREENVDTFDGAAETLRFCGVLPDNNATICMHYWHFVAPHTLHFNFTGQFGGFLLDHMIDTDRFKFGVSIKDWAKHSLSPYTRISLMTYYSEPVVGYQPILAPTSWEVTLEPSDDSKAHLNLTLFNFAEEEGQLRYVTWTSLKPGVANGSETLDKVQTFNHLLDVAFDDLVFYDPDFSSFFKDMSVRDEGPEEGGDDTKLIAILVAVLVPMVVVTMLAVVIGVGLVVLFRNKLNLWLHKRKHQKIIFGSDRSSVTGQQQPQQATGVYHLIVDS